ncbi:MAG: nucleoside hydrolase [Candidatus Helarchaeota archaeon]
MNLIIDTDPGLGDGKIVDVDDGLAIFMALGSEEIDLKGITVTHGNTPLHVGFRLLKEYLKVAQRTDIPSFRGASSNEDFGKRTDATDFLIRSVKEHPSDLSILTLGPLTNIASAAKIYPEFFDDIKNLVMMGTCINPPFGLKFLSGEFNIGNDHRAAALVLAAPILKVVVGMDVCTKVKFTKQQMVRIKKANSRVARYIAHHMYFWYGGWSLIGGFYPWDPIALGCYVKPSLYKCARVSLQLQEKSNSQIAFSNHRVVIVPNVSPNSRLCLDVNAPAFLDLFVERLLNLP